MQRSGLASFAIVAVFVAFAPNVAGAQPLSAPLNYDVKNMSFDYWCRDVQQYAGDRCTARRAEDLTAFEAYRSSVERYELDYLKRVQREKDLRASTNRDPSQSARERQDATP